MLWHGSLRLIKIGCLDGDQHVGQLLANQRLAVFPRRLLEPDRGLAVAVWGYGHPADTLGKLLRYAPRAACDGVETPREYDCAKLTNWRPFEKFSVAATA